MVAAQSFPRARSTVFALVLVVVSILAPRAGAAASDGPHAPRLAAGRGLVAGGFQIESGDEGSFSLFSARENGDDLRPLGQFYGRLAGVALDDGGALLALTRDGALGRYGDDVEPLAEPDSRWNMAALFWLDGAPLAFTNDEGRLYQVRLDAGGKWIQDERPVADVGSPVRVDGVSLEDGFHLMILSVADDLSRGALRHLVRAGDVWRELPSLPLGDVSAFAVLPTVLPRELFPENAAPRPGVVALRRDPLLPERGKISFHAWRGGAWTRLPLADGFADALLAAQSFTAAADGSSDAAWLLAGPNGAFLTPSGSTPDAVAIRVGKEARAEGWNQWSGLFTLVGLIGLIVIYCRRSRALSRTYPARPPDLFSRGAALAVDWILVSFLMSGYHVANGDVNILPRLLNFDDVQTVFWANLAALIAFTSLFEALFGRTPGKHLAGLRVRSALGGRATFLQALLRNVLRVIDMLPVAIGFPGLIGAIATLLNKRRQRLGDMISATIVRRHWPLEKRRYLLASASPRRLELMRALGLEVRAEAMDIDENMFDDQKPVDAVCRLSQEKARAAGGRIRPGEIVVAADTIVVLDGRTLGKPATPEEAKRMLSDLSGRSHTVFTGVTVWDTATGQGMTQHEETEVEFRQLSEHEIDSYVASGDPMDKAGGYGVQSGFLVKQVRGSLSNVAGLPMEKLQSMLSSLDS